MFAEHRVTAVLRDGGVAATEELLCEELTFMSVPRGVDDEGERLRPRGEPDTTPTNPTSPNPMAMNPTPPID